ncbi:MAG: cyclic nucleotide-binding domain-containing protein [Candidatus Gracilibacteria bacterium]|jgi:CRP-like cAMP-binding protein
MTDFSILPILQNIPLFKGLDASLHQEIIKDITLQYYPANYQLFNEGDIGTKMYIIKRGSVRIYKQTEEVATLGEKAFFGEMALISEQPRTASAKTIEESEIFVLEKHDFDLLLSKNPTAEKAIKDAFTIRSSLTK